MTLSIVTTTLSLDGTVLSQQVTGEKDVREQDYLEAQTLLLTGHGSKELIEKFRKEKNLGKPTEKKRYKKQMRF